jgi:cardiolipin synthase A/B
MSHSWEFYTNTEEAWVGMVKACEGAERSIDMETYIFVCNEIGKKFLGIMKQKAQEGVRVRLLLDMAGSYNFYKQNIQADLEKHGVQVRFFNVISPWRIKNFFSWFFRNHKKTLVVDGTIGFTGGTGVGDHMKNWRDTTARLTGDVVKEISDSFEEVWELSGDQDFLERVQSNLRYKKRANFVTNAPYLKKRFLYHAMMKAFKKAKKEILLTTPYFVPNRPLINVLRKAARRGVEVKIILPEHVDVPTIATASHSSFDELLEGGIRIFKYRPQVIHSKTAMVDGDWGTYGSFNLDNLSFVYNYEANIVTTDPKCVKDLKDHFNEDLEHSREVTLKEWKKRPFLRKVQEFFITPIRGFL